MEKANEDAPRPEWFVDQVVNGDSLDVLPLLPSESVDCALTDPPYLVNYRSRDGRKIAGDRDDAWLPPAMNELYRVLKRDAWLVSFYGWNAADRFLQAWRDAGFRVVGHIVWVKRYASRTDALRAQHECAYVLAKGKPKAAATIPDVLEWRYSGNVYHPTQKPVGALIPLVLAFSRPGDVILDPFAGSGTTAIAARELGRKYLCIEKDEKYAQIAYDRLRTTR